MLRRTPRGGYALVLALTIALAGLLLGGLMSQSSGRPSANPAAIHCPPVPHGPPPAHHTSLVIGLNSVWNDDCNLAAVAAAGVTVERLEIPWSSVEPRPGKWRFGNFDQEFARAARHGITMLPLLMNVPRWAGPAWNALPARPGRFAAYVARVVGRYGPHGSFWRRHRDIPARPASWFEIWNEPYLSDFSAGGIKPARYARLFKTSVVAGRRTDGSARFLIGADLSGLTASGHPTPWVGPMFAAVPGLARYIDGVAVHPYSSTKSPDSYDPSNPRDSFRRIALIRQQFAAQGAGSKPFWITEVGWSSCPANPTECVSDPTQAAYLARVFAIVKSDYSSFVRAVIPYNYRDSDEGNGTDKEAWFGLIRRDGTPKSAWNVLRAAARS